MAVTLMGSALNNIHIGNSGGGSSSGGGASVGTFASRPAAGTAGRIYIATDSPIAQWVDDGTAWRPLLLGQALGTQVPAASAFTSFNAGGGAFSFSQGNGVIDWSCNSAASLTLRGAAISHSSATAYVDGVLFTPSAGGLMSLVMRESSTGKSATVLQVTGEAPNFQGTCYFGVITYSGDARVSYQKFSGISANGPAFFRLQRNGATGVIVRSSMDGITWTTCATLAGVFSSAPDQVGFGLQAEGACEGRLLSFKYGSL